MNIYTVGQINAYIKNMFEQDYFLHSVIVSGEVSNLKYHSSGHIYFTLKDESGILSAVMFRSNAQTVLRESISLFARTKMLPVTISIKKTTTNRQVRTTLSLIRRPAISM